jgi:hypothetical protein
MKKTSPSRLLGFVSALIVFVALDIQAQNPPDAYAIKVDGTIGQYEIQGAPDLGIAVGDPFTAIFQYWGRGPNNPPFSGNHLWYHFQAVVMVDGITLGTGPDASGSVFAGDLISGGGSGNLLAPGFDYSPFFSQMSLGTTIVDALKNPFGGFIFDASGSPTSSSPNGASLHILGDLRSIDLAPFTAAHFPEPALTGGLLVLALGALLVIHRSILRCPTVSLKPPDAIG